MLLSQARLHVARRHSAPSRSDTLASDFGGPVRSLTVPGCRIEGSPSSAKAVKTSCSARARSHDVYYLGQETRSRVRRWRRRTFSRTAKSDAYPPGGSRHGLLVLHATQISSVRGEHRRADRGLQPLRRRSCSRCSRSSLQQTFQAVITIAVTAYSVSTSWG